MTEEEKYRALNRWYHKRTIELLPYDTGVPAIITIFIPNHQDDEEYIDAYLDGMLNEFLRYNCDWVFV